MRTKYHKEIDLLCIDLSEQPSAESREVSEGIVLGYDVKGNLVVIDIDNARLKVDLECLIVSSLPGDVETDAA